MKLSPLNKTAKTEIGTSQLVVIDYISTSHLESFSMDIPTIIFLDNRLYFLNEKYSDFYKPLIDVGICQTDPKQAAKFVENISKNPKEWWHSFEVQKAKNKFMETNIGNPETMINYLRALCN